MILAVHNNAEAAPRPISCVQNAPVWRDHFPFLGTAGPVVARLLRRARIRPSIRRLTAPCVDARRETTPQRRAEDALARCGYY
eukprot:gene11248-biopygen2650